MSSNVPFTSENLDTYLKALAKEYKKLSGKSIPAEIILIGGAAILANYGFRESTYDMDALISASSAMGDAISHVGDKYGLPNGWLNEDFIKTKSYTPKLRQYSVHYKEFGRILEIRTVQAEYLLAMKMVSARDYKNDLSDIIGIIAEHQQRLLPLTWEMVERAMLELYGSWERVALETVQLVRNALTLPDAAVVYDQYRAEEIATKDFLTDFEQKYPKVANQDNIASILAQAKKKREQQTNDTP